MDPCEYHAYLLKHCITLVYYSYIMHPLIWMAFYSLNESSVDPIMLVGGRVFDAIAPYSQKGKPFLSFCQILLVRLERQLLKTLIPIPWLCPGPSPRMMEAIRWPGMSWRWEKRVRPSGLPSMRKHRARTTSLPVKYC